MQRIIQALADGKILKVEWNKIQEMLGENPAQQLSCTICQNDGTYPPEGEETFLLTQDEIFDALTKSNVNWLSDIHDPDAPIPLLGHIMVRYFSSKKPSAGPWMGNPNRH